MVSNIREQDVFQKNFQKAIKEALHREVPNKNAKTTSNAVPEDEAGSRTQSDNDEDVSEVLSIITKRMVKKTEEQRDAEVKALQAFLLECERRKVYTKPMLKELKAKALRLVNIKLDSGLQQALGKFIEEGAKGALALNSVVFAQNGLGDNELGKLLAPLATESARIQAIVAVRNGFGERSLAALERIVGVTKPAATGQHLQELNLNGARIAKKSVLAELLKTLSSRCSRLRRLGLSG